MPFVMKELVSRQISQNIKHAKKLVEKLDQAVWDVLEDVIKEHPVMFFHGKRKMYRHLVSVEIGIKCRTNKRMKLNRLTLDKNRVQWVKASSLRMSTKQFLRMRTVHVRCIQGLR